MKLFISTILSVFFVAFLLIFPKVSAAAVSESITACLNIIIPSLFAFSAIAIFLQGSGLYRVIFKPITVILAKILRVNEEILCIFLLSNIGGYPVGASLLSASVKERRLSERDAGRLLCCCFASGPSFIIGMVGTRVFNSAAIGGAIFGACFLSSLVCFVLMRISGDVSLNFSSNSTNISAETFVISVKSSAKAMFSVCVMVVAFSVVAAALREIGVNSALSEIFLRLGFGENAEKIFPALLDVTKVKDFSPTKSAPAVCAALLSFGGICVLLQIMAIFGKIPLRQFLLSRLLSAVLSGILAYLFTLPLSPELETFSAASAAAARLPDNTVLSLCVLMMSGILLSDKNVNRSDVSR